MSNVAKRNVMMAFPHWLMMIICLRATRSASTPPNREAKVRGRAKDIITRDRAKGESSVSRRISHPLVICCMVIAMNEVAVPSHNQRKSRYRKE